MLYASFIFWIVLSSSDLVEKNLISNKVLNDPKMGKVFKNALQEVFDIELNQYVLKEEESIFSGLINKYGKCGEAKY